MYINLHHYKNTIDTSYVLSCYDLNSYYILDFTLLPEKLEKFLIEKEKKGKAVQDFDISFALLLCVQKQSS